MSNVIIDTGNLAEMVDFDEDESPQSDIAAIKEPEGKGIEFHVQMRSYTQRDMENLIVQAAAKMILDASSRDGLSKQIQKLAIEKTTALANEKLATVAADIIDQPITPAGAKQPVTMREFIGLVGREYLTEMVDHEGKPKPSDSYGWRGYGTRMQWLVGKAMDRNFKNEIEKTTYAAINEIQAEIRTAHIRFLDAEKAKIRDALAKATA